MAGWTRASLRSSLQGHAEPELISRLNSIIETTADPIEQARINLWGGELLMANGTSRRIWGAYFDEAARLDRSTLAQIADALSKARRERSSIPPPPDRRERLASSVPPPDRSARGFRARAYSHRDGDALPLLVSDARNDRPSVRPVSDWNGHSIGIVPSQSAILITGPSIPSIVWVSHFVDEVLHYFTRRAEEDEQPEPNDILLEASLIGEGWYSSVTVTAKQASEGIFRHVAKAFRFAGAPILSVLLELPQLHLSTPLGEEWGTDNGPKMFSMLLAPAAYRRTPGAIAALLARDDPSGFTRWFEEALGNIDV